MRILVIIDFYEPIAFYSTIYQLRKISIGLSAKEIGSLVKEILEYVK